MVMVGAPTITKISTAAFRELMALRSAIRQHDACKFNLTEFTAQVGNLSVKVLWS
jgi:hypothetical protein